MLSACKSEPDRRSDSSEVANGGVPGVEVAGVEFAGPEFSFGWSPGWYTSVGTRSLCACEACALEGKDDASGDVVRVEARAGARVISYNETATAWPRFIET